MFWQYRAFIVFWYDWFIFDTSILSVCCFSLSYNCCRCVRVFFYVILSLLNYALLVTLNRCTTFSISVTSYSYIALFFIIIYSLSPWIFNSMSSNYWIYWASLWKWWGVYSLYLFESKLWVSCYPKNLNNSYLSSPLDISLRASSDYFYLGIN